MGLLGGLLREAKRTRLVRNKTKGKMAEDLAITRYGLHGYSIKRTGRGSDYEVSKRSWRTGRKKKKLVEVKSGRARLSKLQRKTYRKHKRSYEVWRF